MPLALSIEELLEYTSEERAKWELFFQVHHAAIDVPFQPRGRFARVWNLVDHIFLVECRHTQRLRGESLPDTSGIASPDIKGLFSYAAANRKRFIETLPLTSGLDEIRGEFRDQVYVFSPRKLILHVAVHEIRHWAQLATILRNADFEIPGDHDLLFSRALA